MPSVTTLAACLATGTVGSVSYAFPVFVMRAPAGRPPTQGVAAMPQINVAVLTLPFLGLFVGAIGRLARVAHLHHQAGHASAAQWLPAATHR
jgi:uncharacterized membrane protein